MFGAFLLQFHAIEHAPGHRSNLGIAIVRHMSRNETWLQAHIIINKNQNFTARSPGRKVSGPWQARPPQAMPLDFAPIGPLGQFRFGFGQVLRGLVNDDHFKIRIVLGEHILDRGAKHLFAPVGGHND